MSTGPNRLARLALAAALAAAVAGCELLLGSPPTATEPPDADVVGADVPAAPDAGSPDAATAPDTGTIAPDAASVPPDAAYVPPPDAGCEVTLTCPLPTNGLVAYYRFDGDGTEANGGVKLTEGGNSYMLD